MLQYLNISESLREVFKIARAFAREHKNETLGASHLLRALMHKEAGLQGFMQSLGKDVSYITEWAEVRIEEYPRAGSFSNEVIPGEDIVRIMDEADKIRLRIGLDIIDPICVLTATVKPGYGYPAEQLKSLPLKENEILEALLNSAGIQKKSFHSPDSQHVSETSVSGALFTYCLDKNSRIREGLADPVIGRDKELLMMAEIIGRRNKPNVLLIGEPGVGKSALVDGFVSTIVNGQVPSGLKNAIVFELDAGALLAGASYKGEVEDRLKKIIKDLRQFEKAVLFIDELHTLIDPKGPAGSGIANLLKPELARGELTLIGATTQEEYRKYIEPDAAFSRRFETLTVQEPDVVTAQKMILALLPAYEKHHGLSLEADAIGESIRLARRYCKDKKLPDAAIDLIDRTMSALRMIHEAPFEEIGRLLTEASLIEESDLPEDEKIAELQWLYHSLINKTSPVLHNNLQEQEAVLNTPDAILERIKTLADGVQNAARLKRTSVSCSDLTAVIAHKTGIPAGKIQAQEKEKLLHIESYLKKRVVGQDPAIKTLADTIVESRSGLNKPGQPIGSFFFLGPTGTGKTELTKALAEFLFNDEKSMLRFDMSEFKEEHSAALLYGAPPGYVGYEEGGMLVNKIRQKPYSVVLFDEIEKAHHSVFDIFLQIMDEGVLHDKLGKEGDFSNAIIIFTSNIGSEWITSQFAQGLIPSSQMLMEVMARHFRPEFLARLSEIVPFAPISEKNVVRILEIQLSSLHHSLERQGIRLQLTPAATQHLAQSGFTPHYGARQLSGVIRNQLRRPIARMIVAGELVHDDVLLADFAPDKNELTWNIIKNTDSETVTTAMDTEKENV